MMAEMQCEDPKAISAAIKSGNEQLKGILDRVFGAVDIEKDEVEGTVLTESEIPRSAFEVVASRVADTILVTEKQQSVFDHSQAERFQMETESDNGIPPGYALLPSKFGLLEEDVIVVNSFQKCQFILTSIKVPAGYILATPFSGMLDPVGRILSSRNGRMSFRNQTLMHYECIVPESIRESGEVFESGSSVYCGIASHQCECTAEDHILYSVAVDACNYSLKPLFITWQEFLKMKVQFIADLAGIYEGAVKSTEEICKVTWAERDRRGNVLKMLNEIPFELKHYQMRRDLQLTARFLEIFSKAFDRLGMNDRNLLHRYTFLLAFTTQCLMVMEAGFQKLQIPTRFSMKPFIDRMKMTYNQPRSIIIPNHVFMSENPFVKEHSDFVV